WSESKITSRLNKHPLLYRKGSSCILARSRKLVVEDLNARYPPDGPAVLHGILFEIQSGERVGVVGRTRGGKSSLTLSLLRVIPIDGNVYYDSHTNYLDNGIPTHAVNLDALRSSITIIPQQSDLMSGTVRQILDPFEEHDDVVLYAGLRSVDIFLFLFPISKSLLSLDSGVSAGGEDLSLG
ncbi:hypothetical protein BDV93DRAFT_595735, partial [Ceratobasidium sp. AG-I]